MKRDQAPVYVRCLELTKWLLERSETFPTSSAALEVRGRIQRFSLELLEGISCALAFKSDRLETLRAANCTVMRLRINLRMAGLMGYLEPSQVRFAHERLDVVGNMVGGWIRQDSGQAIIPDWTSPAEG